VSAPPERRPPRAWIQYAAVVRKEVLQTLRDRRVMFMLLFAPFLQTLVLGFAVDFDVDRVPTVVADQDRSQESREHLRRVLADGTLRFAGGADSAEEGAGALDRGEAATLERLGSVPSRTTWTSAVRPAARSDPKRGGMTSTAAASPRSSAPAPSSALSAPPAKRSVPSASTRRRCSRLSWLRS
jgi:ABC-type Na+ efflux pump permease subunit